MLAPMSHWCLVGHKRIEFLYELYIYTYIYMYICNINPIPYSPAMRFWEPVHHLLLSTKSGPIFRRPRAAARGDLILTPNLQISRVCGLKGADPMLKPNNNRHRVMVHLNPKASALNIGLSLGVPLADLWGPTAASQMLKRKYLEFCRDVQGRYCRVI